MREQIVDTEKLPSKGKFYPDNIEIYVKPLTIKEQLDIDRYGISRAEYYRRLKNSIVVKGNFNVDNLLFNDAEYLDLFRRLLSFDLSDTLIIKDYICGTILDDNSYCSNKLNFDFKFSQIEFSDFKCGISEEYTFSDGLRIKCKPVTLKDYIELCNKYLMSNDNTSDFIIGYYTKMVTEVIDREFKDRKALDNFLVEYFSNISLYKDKIILEDLMDKYTSSSLPFYTICPKCGNKVEVIVDKDSRFHQE